MSGALTAPSFDPLIAEARRRARRRRAGVAAIVVAAGGAAWAATRGDDGRPAPVVLPRLELRAPPGMGVACPSMPNSIACDRVAIAVMLQRPASNVTATVGGRTAVLRRQGSKPFYSGYLQPAGLIDGALKVVPDHGPMRWWGAHPKFATMTIRAKGYAPVRQRVELSPGWG